MDSDPKTNLAFDRVVVMTPKCCCGVNQGNFVAIGGFILV